MFTVIAVYLCVNSLIVLQSGSSTQNTISEINELFTSQLSIHREALL